MIGYDSTISEKSSPAEGVEHIAMRFDLNIEEWETITRADLVFEDLSTIGSSYALRVFFNNKKATAETERTAKNGYAGRLTIFGHGDCLGSEGHCSSVSKVDVRLDAPAMPLLQHPTAPMKRILTVTPALDRVMRRYSKGLHTVTLVTVLQAPLRRNRKPMSGLLKCRRVSLRTYS